MSTTIAYIDYVTFTYQFVLSIFNLTIGMVSNIAIIAIFTSLKVFKGNQCAFYLTVESVTNIGLLLAFFPSTIISYLIRQNLTWTYVAWCKIQLMCGYGFGLCSLYTICFMTFDQYLSTNHRYSWRQLSTIRLAQRLVLIIILLALIHSVIFVVFAQVDILGCTIYDPIVKLYLSYFFYPVLICFLPLTISVTFSLLAYQNVRRIVRRQLPVYRRRLDRQMTALALSRALCIVMLFLPFIAVTLYEFNLSSSGTSNMMQLAIYRLVSVVAYSLLYLNYCVSPFETNCLIGMRLRFRSTSMSFVSSHHVIVIK